VSTPHRSGIACSSLDRRALTAGSASRSLCCPLPCPRTCACSPFPTNSCASACLDSWLPACYCLQELCAAWQPQRGAGDVWIWHCCAHLARCVWCFFPEGGLGLACRVAPPGAPAAACRHALQGTLCLLLRRAECNPPPSYAACRRRRTQRHLPLTRGRHGPCDSGHCPSCRQPCPWQRRRHGGSRGCCCRTSQRAGRAWLRRCHAPQCCTRCCRPAACPGWRKRRQAARLGPVATVERGKERQMMPPCEPHALHFIPIPSPKRPELRQTPKKRKSQLQAFCGPSPSWAWGPEGPRR
jgi:hypothetical protein